MNYKKKNGLNALSLKIILPVVSKKILRSEATADFIRLAPKSIKRIFPIYIIYKGISC